MLSLFYYKKGVIYEKIRTTKTRLERNKRKKDDTEERLRQVKNQEKKIL